MLKSSPVSSFINAPDARGASINITDLLWGERAACRAADTPSYAVKYMTYGEEGTVEKGGIMI